MKKTRINRIGRIGRINQKAAKINKQWFNDQDNKICRVPGCTNIATDPHHRYRRNYYKHKNEKQMIENLTNQTDIKWLCRGCHILRAPESWLSEELWKEEG